MRHSTIDDLPQRLHSLQNELEDVDAYRNRLKVLRQDYSEARKRATGHDD